VDVVLSAKSCKSVMFFFFLIACFCFFIFYFSHLTGSRKYDRFPKMTHIILFYFLNFFSIADFYMVPNAWRIRKCYALQIKNK
jgi:hypothetical protein